jgi:hypothetical protein
MKIDELKGTLLDYWVAKAEGLGPEVEWIMPTWNFSWRAVTERGIFTAPYTESLQKAFAERAAQAG